MQPEKDYLEINKKGWDSSVEHHLRADFYKQEEFMNGKSSLNDIELDLLGDITGKTLLHLQCHFGQDSFSLERLGAKVTGIDFSDKAIETANEIAKELPSKATFICSDV